MAIYDKLKHSIRYWLLRRLPTCQHTVQTLSQSLERRLNSRERVTIKLHLWICAWCQWYIEQLQLIRVVAREQADAPDPTSGPGLSDTARERIRRKLTSSN